jgi:hypothetical protein
MFLPGSELTTVISLTCWRRGFLTVLRNTILADNPATLYAR